MTEDAIGRYRRLVRQAQADERVPALSVALHRGDRPLWTCQVGGEPGRLFRLGSITKTFTGLALAIADRAGRLSLDDPLRDHLPSNFPVPTRGDKPITLAHLSTHASGLPQLPPGLLEDPELDPKDPYAHFTEAKLITALGKTTLLSDPGTKYL
ncbi:MAG: serine-type D-Ala-D-Ala carboxypeptidase/endopeptidase, partial [Micromonosporaceae bacterium]